MENKFNLLIQSFAPLLTYIKNFEKNNIAFDSFESFDVEIHKLVDESKKFFPQDYKLWKELFFPIASYIDEVVLLSQWQHKRQWRAKLFQKNYFKTLSAGILFFKNLDNLIESNGQPDVKFIYFVVLQLGFKGKFYNKDTYGFDDMYESLKLDISNYIKVNDITADTMLHGREHKEIEKKFDPFLYKQLAIGGSVFVVYLIFVSILMLNLSSSSSDIEEKTKITRTI